MASNHYNIEEEIEVIVKVKVKNLCIHNYHKLSESELEESVESFKSNISEELQGNLADINHSYVDITDNADGCSFDIE